MPELKMSEYCETWTWLALDRNVLVVASKGEIDDWCAYIGAVEGKDHKLEANRVYQNGSKLPYWIAKKLFPSMDKTYTWRE